MSGLKVDTKEFNRLERKFAKFTDKYPSFVLDFREKIANRVIDEARIKKPDLSGRTGLLNRSYYATHTGEATNIQNPVYYFDFVEEGFEPAFQLIIGVFDGKFRTGHGNAMFFWRHSKDGGVGYIAPQAPVEGFHMLEKAVKTIQPRIPLMYYGDLNKFLTRMGLK